MTMTINDLFDVTSSVEDHTNDLIHSLVLKNIKGETIDEITDEERETIEALAYEFEDEYTPTARMVAYALRWVIGAA